MEDMLKMREFIIDEQGIKRFKANKIVVLLRETNEKIDMNTIVRLDAEGLFNEGDIQEFYQLIGYSESGYEDIFGDAEQK